MSAPRWLQGLASVALLAGLVACASPATRVTLLPQAGGTASAVEVRTGDKSQRLDQAYQVAVVDTRGGLGTETSSVDDVRKRYGSLLERQPAAAQRFTLYFASGGLELTPESEAEVTGIVQAAKGRPGGEMVVVGHTDRVGSLEDNDALSLRRAQSIAQLIVARGFAAELLEAVGRGEREPLVPTEDEVAEPRNRRVDIIIR